MLEEVVLRVLRMLCQLSLTILGTCNGPGKVENNRQEAICGDKG
jgi:hypothetical protein